MLVMLQRVIEESNPVLLQARLDAEERRNNTRVREEQDAAYRAALEADQVCCLWTWIFFVFFGLLVYALLFRVIQLASFVILLTGKSLSLAGTKYLMFSFSLPLFPIFLVISG